MTHKTERRPWLLAPTETDTLELYTVINHTNRHAMLNRPPDHLHSGRRAKRRRPGRHRGHFVQRTQAIVGRGDRVQLCTWKCTLCGCFDNLVERRWGFPVRQTLLPLNDYTICHKSLSPGEEGGVWTSPAIYCWIRGSARDLTSNLVWTIQVHKYTGQHLKWIKTFHQSCPKT